jgi:hypothetical protein
VEQISHHPPITTWEMTGSGFTYTGQAGYQASIRGNALKGCQLGPNILTFNEPHTVIMYEQPIVWLKGIMWGGRYVLKL